MPEPSQVVQDVFVDSIEEVLFKVGRGIAQAQTEMDRSSLATQVLIDNDEILSKTGIQATWYHIPETTVELKVSVSMQWEEIKRAGKPIAWKRALYLAPQNAAYQNLFGYDATSTSVIRTRIVSVPPATTIGTE